MGGLANVLKSDFHHYWPFSHSIQTENTLSVLGHKLIILETDMQTLIAICVPPSVKRSKANS